MSAGAPANQGEALPEAWLYRADHLSSKVFHIRYGVLNGHAVELYKGDHMVLENAFPLTEAKISSVHTEECDVKPQGVSMLMGYFDGSIESKLLHTFKIKVSRTQSIIHNKLVLGFESREDAQFWHDKISAIGHNVGTHHSTSGSTAGKVSSRQIHVDDSGPLRTDLTAEPAPARALSYEDSGRYGPAAPPPPRPPPLRVSPMPQQAPLNPAHAWEPQFNSNGLAGYREPEEGTVATCCCVGASPTQVFQHLVLLPDGTSAWALFENVRVLTPPTGEGDGMVFHARLGTGWMSWLGRCIGVAPRDVVLRQSWQLRDADGVIALSFTSVEHSAAPPAQRSTWLDVFTQWFKPVRAQIHRMAFTVAPLAQHLWDSDGRNPEDAPESMVTMLVRADFGGLLAPTTALPGVAMLWLAPLVKSLIQVRDTLHQKRFVDPLFNVVGEPPAAAAASRSPSRVASNVGPLQRLASSLSMRLGAAVSAAAASDAAAAAVAAADDDSGGVAAAAEEAGATGAEEPVGWLPERFYYQPPGHEFKVRGANYLLDKRKQPSAEPAFRLKAVEVCTTEGPLAHISPFLPVVAHSLAPFLLVLHFTLPHGGCPTHLAIVFEADADPTAEEGAAAMTDGDGPCARALAEWLTGALPADDYRRSAALKLIPMVKNGGWLVRQAVGTTPVIIGTKLATTYHRGARHLEATVDISSNATAASIANYVAGSVSSLAIWMGFVLEGKTPDHLPERLLGTVCLDHLDLKAACHLDTSKPVPARAAPAPACGGRASATSDTSSPAPPTASTESARTAARRSASPAPAHAQAGQSAAATAAPAAPAAAATAARSVTPPPTRLTDAATGVNISASSSGSAQTASSYEMVEPPLRRRVAR
eukprot:jgi/Ulvmu1/7762/UM039_0070.1